MKTLIELSGSIEQRRRDLGLKQSDMLMKIGMSQQQYQRVEAGHDIRVSTLLLVLEGMGLELLIAPRERVRQMEDMLSSGGYEHDIIPADAEWQDEIRESAWSSLLAEFEDE